MISLYRELEQIEENVKQDTISSAELERLLTRKESIEDEIRLSRSFQDCGIGSAFCEAKLEDLKEDSIKSKVENIQCHEHEFEEKDGKIVLAHSREIYLYKVLKNYFDNIDTHLQLGDGIVFTGLVGRGKTHAAISLVLDIIRYKRIKDFNLNAESTIRRVPTFHFISMQDLLALMASRSWKSDDIIESIRSKDILIIDDIGSESQNLFGKEIELVIHRIIKFRDHNNLITIITSNVAPKEFGELYGKRAGSVLCGEKYTHITIQTTKSWRLSNV